MRKLTSVRILFVGIVLGLSFGALAAERTLAPPVAAKIPHVERRFGQEIVDDYFWLRDRDNPQVTQYLEAENAYTKEILSDTETLQKQLFNEMLARIKEDDTEVPEPLDEFEYYSRTVEGRPYKIHCRRRGADGPEEIVLDENALAEGHKYFDLGIHKVSPDHNLVAYAVDTNGSEKFTLHIKDLRTGEVLPDAIPDTYYSLEWAGDNRTLFYTTIDAASRPYRLHRHTLGTDPASDQIVHEERDEAYFVELKKTKNQKFLILQLDSNTTSEARYLSADDSNGEFRIIHPREHRLEYKVEQRGDKFYILTNDGAVNFKIVRARVADPAKKNWRDYLPHRPEVKLDAVAMFAGHLAIVEREGGLRGVRIIDLSDGTSHRVAFDEPAYSIELDDNPEFDTQKLRFTYESLLTPKSVFDYDMRGRTRDLRKRNEVLGGYDRSNYVSERVWATAEDGAKIPISLFFRKGLERNGRNPLLLNGYGAYGICEDPEFRSNRLSLVDRGFVWAVAHIRGGGEMGRPWYEDGKLQHKRNTFTDFIAVAEHLVREGFTSSERLAISGGSAGGLLMGAVTNMRPDLFRAVVAQVPFVDVMNTMSDASIPLTVTEWEEWGDPRKPADYKYMLSYSPYDNVAKTAYPHLFVTAGLNDPRVGYWEPAKWVAKMRTMKTNDNLLLLKTHMGAGHAGASGRYGELEDIALDYAFILKALDVR